MHYPSFDLVPFGAPSSVTGPTANVPDIEIAGRVAFDAGGLRVEYEISSAPGRVKHASAASNPARKNDLWRTTCFELFVVLPGSTDYWEYNLSPSGDWNVYHFSGYRSDMQPEAHITGVEIVADVMASRLVKLDATLPLPPSCVGRSLMLGVSSVIEDTEGAMHYFALCHSGLKPDFHDAAGFILHLDPKS